MTVFGTRGIPLGLAILLSACGGGGSGDSPAEDTTGGPTGGTVTGAVSDGTTAGGTTGNTTAGETTTGGTTTGGTTTGETTTGGSTTGGTTTGGTTTGGSTTGGTTTGGSTTGGSTTGGAPEPPSPSSATPVDRGPLLALRGPARIDQRELPVTLGHITTLMRGRSAIAMFDYVHGLEQTIRNGTSPLTDLNITQGFYNRIHTCPGGGRQLAAVQSDTPRRYISTVRFEGCVLDGQTIVHGTARLLYERETRREVETVEVSISSAAAGDPLRLIDTRGLMQAMDGTISQASAISPTGRAFSTSFLMGTSYGYALFEPSDLDRETFDLSDDAALEFGLVRLGATDFVQTTAFDTSRPNRVSTFGAGVAPDDPEVDEDVAFTYTLSMLNSAIGGISSLATGAMGGDFAVGQVDVELGDDDRRLVLQADNGDPASFDVLIFDADDSVVSFTLPWNEDTRFEMPPRAAALDFVFATD